MRAVSQTAPLLFLSPLCALTLLHRSNGPSLATHNMLCCFPSQLVSLGGRRDRPDRGTRSQEGSPGGRRGVDGGRCEGEISAPIMGTEPARVCVRQPLLLSTQHDTMLPCPPRSVRTQADLNVTPQRSSRTQLNLSQHELTTGSPVPSGRARRFKRRHTLTFPPPYE